MTAEVVGKYSKHFKGLEDQLVGIKAQNQKLMDTQTVMG